MGINMYCRNCGSKIENDKKNCSVCGFSIDVGNKYCFSCGKIIEYSNVNKCPRCSAVLKEVVQKEIVEIHSQKSMLAAGLLQVAFPFFAIGNFYLGFYKKAFLQIGVTFLTLGIGFLWPFIDGLRMLSGKVKVDAYGLPLKD